MTLVLGIDPGTATTGYGLVRQRENGNLEPVEHGIIKTPAGLPSPSRLSILFHKLNELILFHHPDACAVEKLFFQRNVSTALAVGQARGVMLLSISEAGLNVWEYTPTEIKKAITGYGKADKHQIQEMVRMLLGLIDIPRPDDAADALAVAITHLNTERYGEL